MKILVVSATSSEIAPFTRHLSNNLFSPSVDVDVLITGIGMVKTTHHLTQHLHNHTYDLCIQAGIAGAFNRSLALGSMVEVQKDFPGDLGVENDTIFQTLVDIGLETGNEFPLKNNAIENTSTYSTSLPKVTAITVNKVHGNEHSIEQVINKFNADIETMEGFSFFYTCKMMNIPCVQLRSISNYVEKRNRAHWKIREAVEQLNTFLVSYIENISSKNV